MSGRPRVVTPSELLEPAALQTPGMRRRQAFAGEDRWIGYVRSEADAWSGWHHHAETETYFYVLDGQIELEVGAERSPMSVGPGDFAHIPGGVIHRERAGQGHPAEVILVRFGRGPTVVNVDGP